MSKTNKKKLNKITLPKGFFNNIGTEFYDDERYYKKLEDDTYILISMSKLLKEQYPEKYKLWLRKERRRYQIYYKKNNKKVKCKCGCRVVEKGIEKHKRTNKHKKLIKEKFNKK
jgi:hypothetical protein